MASQALHNQVQEIISQHIVGKLQLAYFTVDANMAVCAVSDNLVDYGFPVLRIGQSIDEYVDFMIGLDAKTKLELPVVSSPSGVPICVNLVPSDIDLTVLITNVSEVAEQRQLLQQAANENELLVEKQNKLMAELESASKELASKNQQLEDASRLQTSFLSGVSHEFRTPLTSIIGYSNLVKNNLNEITNNDLMVSQSAHNSADYLDAVQRSSKHLLSLVENLLDHGKFDSEEIILRPKPVCLYEIFDDVKLVLAPLSDTKGIKLRVNLSVPEATKVILDDSRLRQCLINLVGNAIKFTDTGGVDLSVNIDTTEQVLTVSVIDTGMGISEQDLEKIRLPFYQAADTGKVGTGLGLTITERIIDMMGGQLDIESTVGQGTTVSFTLPAPILPSDQACVENAILSKVSLNVLLAEDDRDIADLVTMMLIERGIEVTHVANGALAVDAIQKEAFDLVLMDIHMPIMTGYEAIAELNKIKSQTPIVVMSASATEADQQKASELGCAAYLIKPVDIEEIVSIAKTVITS